MSDETTNEELVILARQASNTMARAAQVDASSELNEGFRNASDLFRALSDRLESLDKYLDYLEDLKFRMESLEK